MAENGIAGGLITGLAAKDRCGILKRALWTDNQQYLVISGSSRQVP